MYLACKTTASLGVASAILLGCASGEQVISGAFSPSYGGIETLLLDGDPGNFRGEMTGARGYLDVADYAVWASAQ